MDKTNIIHKLGIQNSEIETKIKRLLDTIIKVDKNHIIMSTDFLSPELIVYIESIFFNFRDLSYKLFGGYDEAEYQKLIVYPDYISEDQIDLDKLISVLDIEYNVKFGEIGHRDVLGSLMGLGIKREKVGDILVENGRAQVFVETELSSYIDANLNKIGRVNVSTKIVGLDNVIEKEYDIKEISTTVKSLRLDSIIAAGFNISRSVAADLIKLERVKVNHTYVKSVSKELNEGDLISVKGKGRIILYDIGNLSKKDRYRVNIKRFV